MGARQWQFGTHADLCVHNGTERERYCSDSAQKRLFRWHRTSEIARWLPSEGLTIRRSPALMFRKKRFRFVGAQSTVWLDIEFINEKLDYVLEGNPTRRKVRLAS